MIDLDTASVVRAQVGPTAWLVLEAVAARAPTGQAVVEVACSTRSLAGIVGSSKDSVARPFRSMADVGIIRRVDHRDDGSGRFASTTYLVDLAAVGITVTTVSAHTAPAPGATGRQRDLPDPLGDQLSLLD